MDKYGDIKSIAAALRITAYIFVAIYAIWALKLLFFEDLGFCKHVAYFLCKAMYGGIGFMGLIGASEFIYLFLDIQENTKRTSELLEAHAQEKKE